MNQRRALILPYRPDVWQPGSLLESQLAVALRESEGFSLDVELIQGGPVRRLSVYPIEDGQITGFDIDNEETVTIAVRDVVRFNISEC